MTKCEIKLSTAQNIAQRTLLILDEHDFWKNSADGEFWESSLHRDLTKLADGRELKTFEKERKLLLAVVKDLEDEIKKK